MTTSTIVVLIDIQNGFARADLSPGQGGSLYVPGGEKVGAVAAGLIRAASDTIFVLSQDFHPADHISFASNHGVAPFSIFRLQRGAEGRYVVDENGALEQTAWPDHCRQGSESALFVDAIMAELPPTLRAAVATHAAGDVLSDTDTRGNTFYVIRKGMRSDLDSYGIATENDRERTTGAPSVFSAIAERQQRAGHSKAVIAIGGLATNFCVEFSHDDLYRYLLPALSARGIAAEVCILTDLSAGIAVSVPGGAWPDLAAALQRMAQKGSRIVTTDALKPPQP
jgi:nicotinamidase/pyrazinamidase